ncbi:hypothetical protein N9J50_01845 [Methylophilaceae bacterium]|jgi:hypothetical protein|nr:hypothetical protein [Methylophilaceae bacterium]|tara:strand:- start:27 stop:188 length:162 start_codon:yes stop_codon:yes gene_type:complete
MDGSNWSVYIYWGFNIGFELYEELIEFEEGDQYPVEYLLINLGCIRIQRGRYA